MDGTPIPTRDHRLAAQSKNYRYPTNLQVAIDANTRLVIASGDPQPGNRNDTIVYRSSGINTQLAGREVMADGGYRGNLEGSMPYRKPRTCGNPPVRSALAEPAPRRGPLRRPHLVPSVAPDRWVDPSRCFSLTAGCSNLNSLARLAPFPGISRSGWHIYGSMRSDDDVPPLVTAGRRAGGVGCHTLTG
ncbi:Transposase IS4 family [Micromonospora lupini str. Lupac 08]|uniref:Transposase IS4 family n=1 Tax=Micromonospora lupini str. Lupac 08 TaxID=1150864 RepID=I0L217_9ACTN|nr:Transposase IS4 family [Micromonospora lupini str. Lupac 08]